MSMTECKGRGIYVIQEDNGFEIHVQFGPDFVDQALSFKSMINEKLSWLGFNIHVCMTLHGDEVYFQSSNFTPWNKSEVDDVFVVIWNNIDLFKSKIRLQKRKRQVRDALNKCNDWHKIECIAEILGV